VDPITLDEACRLVAGDWSRDLGARVARMLSEVEGDERLLASIQQMGAVATDRNLCLLGVHALETLLEGWDSESLAPLRRAATDERFRKMLSCVWFTDDMAPEVQAFLRENKPARGSAHDVGHRRD
jgi:hypothetical protein